MFVYYQAVTEELADLAQCTIKQRKLKDLQGLMWGRVALDQRPGTL